MRIFYAFALCGFAFFPKIVHAQIYKCTTSAGAIFQQTPCEGGVKLQDKSASKANTETKAPKTEAASASTTAPKPEGSFAPTAQNQGPNIVCPSNFEIRNAETSASSVTDPVGTNVAKKALVAAMKKCPRKLTCAEILTLAPTTRIAYDAAQLYSQLSEVTKQPYLQLDKDRDTKLCEAYKY
jgi:hypothetical protein